MTQEQLNQALQSIGLPVVYDHFSKPPPPPYLVYLFAYSDDFMADNQNYKEISNYQLELYTKIKSPTTESLVENKLRDLQLPYTKTGTFIETEGLYQALYLFQVIGG